MHLDCFLLYSLQRQIWQHTFGLLLVVQSTKTNLAACIGLLLVVQSTKTNLAAYIWTASSRKFYRDKSGRIYLDCLLLYSLQRQIWQHALDCLLLYSLQRQIWQHALDCLLLYSLQRQIWQHAFGLLLVVQFTKTNLAACIWTASSCTVYKDKSGSMHLDCFLLYSLQRQIWQHTFGLPLVVQFTKTNLAAYIWTASSCTVYKDKSGSMHLDCFLLYSLQRQIWQHTFGLPLVVQSTKTNLAARIGLPLVVQFTKTNLAAYIWTASSCTVYKDKSGSMHWTASCCTVYKDKSGSIHLDCFLLYSLQRHIWQHVFGLLLVVQFTKTNLAAYIWTASCCTVYKDKSGSTHWTASCCTVYKDKSGSMHLDCF